MAKVRIGFVGVGGMGQAAHLQNYAVEQDCEVVAIAELRPKLAQRVAARYGISKIYPSHKELLASESVDGIVAIQPFTLHAHLVPDLLEKGVPVITEKPLAESLESGQKVLSAARKHPGKLFLAYHKRSDLGSVYAKQLIDSWKASGEFGAFRYVRVSMPPGDWIANGFWNMLGTDEGFDGRYGEHTPYIAFVNYYIHQVNLLRYLFGEDYQVTAADPAGITMSVLSNSGISGTLEMSTHTNTIDWQEEAFIAFEKAWIKLELTAPVAINRCGKVTVFRDNGKGEPTTTSVTLPWVHPMRSQAQNFIKAIKGEPTPLCGPEDAMKDLQIAKDYLDAFEVSKQRFKK